MFGALTRMFTSSVDAGRRHSAAIDAQLALDDRAIQKIVHILVLGLTGGGKSALLRLLASGRDVPDVTEESVLGDGGGVEEDSCSRVSSVTLTPGEDYVVGQQEVEEKKRGKDDNLNYHTADSINEVLVEDSSTLRFLFTKVPSTLSRKAILQFEGRTPAIVYSLDLSSYADTASAAPLAPLSLHPAPTLPNQLQASLDHLQSLLHIRENSIIPEVVIVLLTKADQLAVKLQVTPFRDYFPSFEGDETVRNVGEYVLTQVRQLHIESYLGRLYPCLARLCVYPALLNLAEEDSARRAAIRAGVLVFVIEITLHASRIRYMSSCGDSHREQEDWAVTDIALNKVAKSAWEGVVLKGWELKLSLSRM